jgi:hypothetical protein
MCYCDRCGKEFKREGRTGLLSKPRKITNITIVDNFLTSVSKDYDLCQKCVKDFWAFMDGGKHG